VESDGTLHAWGYNYYGQLGNGGTSSEELAPILVVGITNAISVVAAADHTLAVTSDGIVWVFGRNDNGQLGDGTQDPRPSPVTISDTGFNWRVGTPTFSVASGTYFTTKTVVVNCATPGTEIHYTLDGTPPTLSSPSVTPGGSVNILVSATLRAKAWAGTAPASNIGERIYELKAVMPTFSPAGGTFALPPTVQMTTTTSGATIRYTTDGSNPTASSPVYVFPPGVNVVETTTLKGAAFYPGWTTSDVRTGTYTMKVGTPTLAPGGGSYSSPTSVTVSSVTPGAVIHYTTTGVEPGPNDPVVTSGGTVLVSVSGTLKAKAWHSGNWTASDTGAATYMIIAGTVATPSFNPPGGTYTSPQDITLSTTTPNAVIRYTLDGGEPTANSLIYQAPISLAANTTIKAKGFLESWTPSATGSSSYVINLGPVATPGISPGTGVYATKQTVTITCVTPGAQIYYTTTGADPTQGDTPIVSGGTIQVTNSSIVKAKAWLGGDESGVRRADVWIVGEVAAGGTHTLALKSDGSLWSWGRNNRGQLGIGSLVDKSSPNLVTGVSDVVAIAAGNEHSLAVTRAGLVYAWGSNVSGQLGQGNSGGGTDRNAPVQVPGLTDVMAVAAGASHSVALTRTGQVLTWGLNANGQLGDGTQVLRTSPVAVPALTGITRVAAGASHTLALKTDGDASGTVWFWGNNSYGAAGDGVSSVTPYKNPVSGLGSVIAFGGGQNRTLSIREDGFAFASGDGALGELGNGLLTGQLVPTPVSVIRDVVCIDGGNNHTLAVTADGQVWAFGYNNSGLLGIDSTWPGTVALPQPLSLTSDVIAASAGGQHSVALGIDGSVWTWGSNGYGQVGLGTTGGTVIKPTRLVGFDVATNTLLTADPDGDGLPNWRELRLGTDPMNADTNGDGISDGAAVRAGISPTNPDMDGDGLANSYERQVGTDPFRADTDGDAVADAADCFPLDSTRSQCPQPNPGDTTPPIITLTEPTNAVLISSDPP
jgi:alpha-tubulin suppressor-like RCC1 family protein